MWRCLTIKNLMALTFPELVDAILNRLGSLHARLGEVTLLDAMLASGRSRPWPEALESFTGSREMHGAALMAYFAPLMSWLEEQNAGHQCGW